MAVETADELAAFFNTDEHAVAATVIPSGSAPSIDDVAVILDEGDQEFAMGDGAVLAQASRGQMLVSAAPDLADGDLLVIDGCRSAIRNPQKNAQRTIWQFQIAPAPDVL